MDEALAGKVVVVTGALGVLGSALVAALRGRGARVAALDRAPAEPAGDPEILQLGGVDLAEEAPAAQAMATVVERFGGLDALVNIAGGFRWETVQDGSLDTFDLLYRMNLRSCVAATRAALPHLRARGSGRIVNVGALGAVRASLGMAAYAASKSGVMRFTEALAEEVKDWGITANAVLPSIIDTPQNRKDMPDADASRWVRPEQLAGVILFLLSPAASAVNGALLPVPGRM